MRTEKYVAEFLIDYGIEGEVSVKTMLKRLEEQTRMKYFKLLHNGYMTRLLNILVKKGVIEFRKRIKKKYMEDRIYFIDLERVKKYLEEQNED